MHVKKRKHVLYLFYVLCPKNLYLLSKTLKKTKKRKTQKSKTAAIGKWSLIEIKSSIQRDPGPRTSRRSDLACPSGYAISCESFWIKIDLLILGGSTNLFLASPGYPRPKKTLGKPTTCMKTLKKTKNLDISLLAFLMPTKSNQRSKLIKRNLNKP